MTNGVHEGHPRVFRRLNSVDCVELEMCAVNSGEIARIDTQCV